MKLKHASKMMKEAGKLIELAATYQSQYGHRARVDATSEIAWKLYNKMLNIQSRIARLLDDVTLDQPYRKAGAWWEQQDVIDVSTAQRISREVNTLIARCAYQTDDDHQNPYALLSTQHSIAGLLHPNSLMIAADKSISWDELRAS